MFKNDITFLHTAEVHIETFSTLVEQQLNITSQHIVKSELLEEAINNGVSTALENNIEQLCLEIAKESQLVVCTCSTLGQIAEKVMLENGSYVIRIDRAMADLAVTTGNRILVLAALQSTLEPTTYLMSSSQQNQQTENVITYCLVDNCWDYFLQGEQNTYLQSIADVIEQKQSDYDCIVLAQASMAGAIELIKYKRAPILSSPEIGVAALVKVLVK
jgi:hypothetical protein